MNILVVYAKFPEEISFYLVPLNKVGYRRGDLVREAHDKMMNSDDTNKGMQFLSDAFSSKPEYCSDDCLEEDKCCWSTYKVDMKKPITEEIDAVYFSGFIL